MTVSVLTMAAKGILFNDRGAAKGVAEGSDRRCLSTLGHGVGCKIHWQLQLGLWGQTEPRSTWTSTEGVSRGARRPPPWL